MSSVNTCSKMDSQKVPSMLILHSNGGKCGNAYLNILKVGPLCAAALAPSVFSWLEVPAEGFFWNLLKFGRLIQFELLHDREIYPPP
jgi:hypothetical protein